MAPSLIIALCIVLALFVIVPKPVWRYLGAYVLITDLVVSGWAISTGVATGTVTGMAAGFIAATGITIMLRVMRARYGSARLAVDGDISMSAVTAAALSQGAHWARAFALSIFRGGRVEAPESRNWSWVETQAPQSWLELASQVLGRWTPVGA